MSFPITDYQTISILEDLKNRIDAGDDAATVSAAIANLLPSEDMEIPEVLRFIEQVSLPYTADYHGLEGAAAYLIWCDWRCYVGRERWDINAVRFFNEGYIGNFRDEEDFINFILCSDRYVTEEELRDSLYDWYDFVNFRTEGYDFDGIAVFTNPY